MFYENKKQETMEIADIQTFMRRDIPKSKEGKCMMACVLKKNDAMTDDGKLSTEGMRTAVDSMAKKYTVKKDIVEKVHQAMVKCTKNVGSTTDDCETAYKFANCFKDEANAKGLMPTGQGAF
ncbi:hypothetical protein AAG570_008567 [Ranatra chinensis]|uniref:Uncharacterized protein n=1 Tax=Ranatra chinensis TaxID=642074 RepID=A0ABD0YRA6_9HEMI